MSSQTSSQFSWANILDIADDAAVQRALDWFLEPLEPNEWNRRKQAIEAHLESIQAARASHDVAGIPEPISITSDKMGWYLYLAECLLSGTPTYEPTQGARVLPIFQRMGTDLKQLTEINGVENKRSQLLSIGSGDADSGLFEILVALLWKKNGWADVSLVPESPPEKRHDIRASNGSTEWAIECKRLAKSSGYSQTEHEKWLRMWMPLGDFLIGHRLPFVFDFVFHIELDDLPDTFLRDELAGKLPLVFPPCVVISNDQWEVSVSVVDFEAAELHLRRNLVKYPSDQLNELVAGYRDPNRGFTGIVGGEFVRVGGGLGNNRYLDKMDFAAGAFWHCDAIRSIEKKARDIRGHLAEAVRQLPDGIPCVIHIGLETLDGVLVEVERYRRILSTVQNFDPNGKNLRWVFCHLYQSYAPPDQMWVFDETVYDFSHTDFVDEKPLSHAGTIVPKEHSVGSEVHWLRNTP